MKPTALFLAFFVLSSILNGQSKIDELPANTITNVSLGVGDASLISLNLEQNFIVNHRSMVSTKIGLGYNQKISYCIFRPCPKLEHYLVLPHHVSYLYGKNKVAIELGLGGAIVLGNTEKNYILFPFLGFRYMPRTINRLTFRAYFTTPFPGYDTFLLFVPYGINFGYNWRG